MNGFVMTTMVRFSYRFSGVDEPTRNKIYDIIYPLDGDGSMLIDPSDGDGSINMGTMYVHPSGVEKLKQKFLDAGLPMFHSEIMLGQENYLKEENV